MKRRVIAALLAAVLVMGSSMSVLAADETESISDKINVVNSMEEDMVEGELQDAVGESVSVPENYEESGENADADNSETAGNLEEPVELAENAGDSNTYHEIDENGLLWDLTDGVLTISGNGVLEKNPGLEKQVDIQMGDIQTGSLKFKVTSVVIEPGVTGIGDEAFAWYLHAKEIFIPDSVTQIGEQAFYGCYDLEEVTIPDGVTKISPLTFLGCYKLPQISIPDSVTEIGDCAFFGCTFSSIVIPDGVIKIGQQAFSHCVNLEEVTIPDSVTEIGDCAFRNCEGLTRITIPDSVTEVKSGTFMGCEKLKKVTIPNSITKIEYSAFSNCKSLSEVTIPDSVKSIAYGSFLECSGLQTVTFRGDVPEISGEELSEQPKWTDGVRIGTKPFEGVTATAYYPSGNTTYTDDVKTAFGTGLTWEENERLNMSFTDVDKGAWFYSAVDFVFFRGIMTGMNDSEFGPSITLSRAQFATILYRMQGEPQMEYDETAFGDVKDKEFYTSAAMWAKSTGVIKGYENGNFGPSDPITREQMAVMMFRYADEVLELDTSVRGNVDEFPDAGEVSSFAEQEMQWAVGEGLIRGNQGKVDPQGSAERAQCATIVMRFMNVYGL